MNRTTIFILVLVAAAVSSNVAAQRYSWSKLERPDQIATIYENIEPACVETLEIDGVRYGRFEGTFLSERAGEVTLRFKTPEGIPSSRRSSRRKTFASASMASRWLSTSFNAARSSAC